MVTQEQILQSLRSVIDPDLKKDVVTLDMIRDVEITKNDVSLRFVLTTPACPFRETLVRQITEAVRRVRGVEHVRIATDASVPQMASIFERAPLPGVRNIISIASGKGGVGKSTVSVNVAAALAKDGARVGLLDADIYGPSIPTMMGIHDAAEIDLENEITPLEVYGIRLMSFGFIAKAGAAVVWRGPLASKAIRQFLKQVKWGELDYLLVDMPPGTGDVHLTLFQAVPLSGGVIVTTPQAVATADAARSIEMFQKLHSPVLGVIENMAGEIFGAGGGGKLAETYTVPYLGSVALDAVIRNSGDAGKPLAYYAPESPSAEAFRAIAGRLAQEISKNALI